MIIKKISLWGAFCIITLNSSLVISWADTGKMPESTSDRYDRLLESGQLDTIDKLTLQDALELSQKYNSDLAAIAWEVRVKEGAALQAGLLPNPELSIEVENFGGKDDLNGFDGSETSIGLSQLIELGGKRTKRHHAALLEKDIAQYDIERKRLEVISETTKAFVDVLAAQKHLEQARELSNLSDSVFQAVVERVNAGKVSPVEQTRSSVERTTALLEVTKAEQGLEKARRSLASQWNGIFPHFKKAIGDLEAVDELPSLESLENIIDQSLEVGRWETIQKHRMAELDLANSMAIPDITAGLGVRNFQETGDQAFFFNMELPLPVFNRNQGGRAEAIAMVRKSRFEKEAVRMEIRSMLASVFQILSSAYAEVTVLRKEGIPAAQTAFESVSTGYREGKFGYLEVLDSQRTLFGVKGQYQAALASYHWAKADMEHLIGRPLDSLKNQIGQPLTGKPLP
ncbi:MAG: TolC family protein [Desulfobacterium sp.]|nr:TolC family protein [Desulfobacterium sp.]